MSFWGILDTILLKPLELIFEVVYMIVYKVTDSSGVSVIMLSLFVNFLALPLYMRADAIQEEEHAIEKKLQRGVDHIKKHSAAMSGCCCCRRITGKTIISLSMCCAARYPCFCRFRFLLRHTGFWLIWSC